VKSIALKVGAQKKELSEDEEDSYQDETLSLLTKKFNIFLKKKNRERFQSKKRYSSKHNESSFVNYTCFGCGKLGNIKVDCPNNLSKDKSMNKKSYKNICKIAYISWEDNDMSSSNDTSPESEKANLCFTVNNEGSSSDSVSICSADYENYDQLLIAFKETHDEANRFVVICNQLKSANSFLELKVKSLEKELHDAQTQLVNLELIYLHAFCKYVESNKIKNCKN